MKKILVSCFLCSFLFSQAQYTSPAQSPRQKIEQQFSLTSISVDYGRPAVKNRVVFGDLVPYDAVWRAGANSSTKISFGEKVNFGGVEVPAGTYGLYIEPSKTMWRIILNKDSQSWGTQYNKELDLYSVKVPRVDLQKKVEWFTISIDPVDTMHANLTFAWDKSSATVPVSVQNVEKTKAIVEKLGEIRSIERAK